jgi:flagellar assembly protein FliH
MASVLKPNVAMVMPATSSPSGLAGFNFEDLSQRAHQQLEHCQQEIARMRAEAKAEIERLRKEAQEEGLKAGRAAAAAEAETKLRKAVDARVGEHGAAVKSMVQQIANMHDEWLKSYADTLVSMVVAVSERVIRGKLDREPEILLRWASESLAAARSANRLTVAVHPETLGELGQSLDELLRHPGLPEDTSIVPDESVPRAGVVVRQVGGEVVATLETQLGRLQELLENA